MNVALISDHDEGCACGLAVTLQSLIHVWSASREHTGYNPAAIDTESGRNCLNWVFIIDAGISIDNRNNLCNIVYSANKHAALAASQQHDGNNTSPPRRPAESSSSSPVVAHGQPELQDGPLLALRFCELPSDGPGRMTATVPSSNAALSSRSLLLGARTAVFPAWAKLAIPSLLPASLTHVLYVDADTLVLEDPTAMYLRTTSLPEMNGAKGRLLAAAVDFGIPCGHPSLLAQGWPEGRRYFNAGVMLINLEAWRSRLPGLMKSLQSRILGEVVGDSVDQSLQTKLCYGEQDALNLACLASGGWIELDPTWNVQVRVTPRKASYITVAQTQFRVYF